MRLRFTFRNLHSNLHPQYSSSLDEDVMMNSGSVLQQDQFHKVSTTTENNTDMVVQEGARRSTYESSRRLDNADQILQKDGENHVSLSQDAAVQKWSENEKTMPLKKRKLIPKNISEEDEKEDEKENYNSHVKSHKEMHDEITRSSVESLLQELPKVNTPMNLISGADDHFNKVGEDCGVEHEKPMDGGETIIQITFNQECCEEKPILMFDSEDKEAQDTFKNITRKRSNMDMERHMIDLKCTSMTVRGWRCTKNAKKGSSFCTYHLEKQEALRHKPEEESIQNHSEQEATPAEKREIQVRKMPKMRSIKFLLEQTKPIQ